MSVQKSVGQDVEVVRGSSSSSPSLSHPSFSFFSPCPSVSSQSTHASLQQPPHCVPLQFLLVTFLSLVSFMFSPPPFSPPPHSTTSFRSLFAPTPPYPVLSSSILPLLPLCLFFSDPPFLFPTVLFLAVLLCKAVFI